MQKHWNQKLLFYIRKFVIWPWWGRRSDFSPEKERGKRGGMEERENDFLNGEGTRKATLGGKRIPGAWKEKPLSQFKC